MKKLLIAFATLASVAAFADGGVRLQYESIPNVTTTKLNTKRVTVDVDGVVVASEVDAKTGAVLSSKEIGRLEDSELEHVNELIEEARGGEAVLQYHPIHCKALALTHQVYSADDGKVFLAKEALCQDPTINTSPAAIELVAFVKELLKPKSGRLSPSTPSLYSCKGENDTKVIYTTSSLIGKPTFSVTFKGQAPKIPAFPPVRHVESALGDEVTVTDNHFALVDGPTIHYTLILPKVHLDGASKTAEFKTMLVKSSVAPGRVVPFTGPSIVNEYAEVQCTAKFVVF